LLQREWQIKPAAISRQIMLMNLSHALQMKLKGPAQFLWQHRYSIAQAFYPVR